MSQNIGVLLVYLHIGMIPETGLLLNEGNCGSTLIF